MPKPKNIFLQLKNFNESKKNRVVSNFLKNIFPLYETIQGSFAADGAATLALMTFAQKIQVIVLIAADTRYFKYIAFNGIFLEKKQDTIL